MGKSQKKTTSLLANLLSACCFSGSDYDSWDDGTRRIWASDEDKGKWIGDRRIDSKASAFIARFHQSRLDH
ncbi:hypothetical protein DCAR_0832650 [Daucus carota subsp. sativus]|uniref:Uncharacterized protein n=1 Tax=Daucus carota subsp. sativus TaxID=79200 RepID=A0A175YRA0_DAUCS|nr:hypothetical protein DCAR_0832650 [Daucus carota subsp. sativus]